MSAQERWDCLLVTFHSLTRLAERTSGTYRRLSLLAEAIRKSGGSLRVCCSLTPDEAMPSLSDACRQIERDITQVWKMDASVVASVSGAPPRMPWMAQQLATAVGYVFSPLAHAQVTREMRALLASELRRRPAVVVAHRLLSMFALNESGVPLPATIFDLDDIEHVIAKRSAEQADSLRDKLFESLRVPSVLFEERRGVRNATKTLVCSDADAEKLRRLFRIERVDVLPNALTLPPALPPLPSDQTMLMVGAYGYGPNADGAEFFISEVFPRIRERIPTARLRLVGANPESVASFATRPAGVEFVGFARDLESEYVGARVVICPIRYGGGTRVKLVEAAGWGKPIVSTTIGAEGLRFVDGVNALIADAPEAFATACVSLLENDDQCSRLGRAARELAEERYDANRISADLGREIRGYIEAQGRSESV